MNEPYGKEATQYPAPADPTSHVVQLEELGELIRAKRHMERITLTQAAAQTGTSAATLSRWERQGGNPQTGTANRAPDMRTVAAITRWLGVTLDQVLGDTPAPIPDVLEMHLRADRNLDHITATNLSKMFRAAYNQAVQETEGVANESES